MNKRWKNKKTRMPKTLKGFYSKQLSIESYKKKIHIIRSTWFELFSFLGLTVLDLEFKASLFFCSPFYFNYATLLHKIIYTLFRRKLWTYALVCRPERFACYTAIGLKLKLLCRKGSEWIKCQKSIKRT